MCWLLIRAFSDDHAASWQLGDIVEVRPDDFTGWGTAEGLPRFYRVQVTGVSADRVKHLLEEAEEHEGVIDGVTRPIVDRVRRWSIQPSDVPAGAMAQLQNTGQLVITKAQALAFIKRTSTGAAPDLG